METAEIGHWPRNILMRDALESSNIIPLFDALTIASRLYQLATHQGGRRRIDQR
jgi:hypothetical protein